MGNKSKHYNLLDNLLEHIRSPREAAISSVEDLAIMIVKRCSAVFTTDPKLLFPLPSLLEIYQEAIGKVASLSNDCTPLKVGQAN
jgi:hypothetical protein